MISLNRVKKKLSFAGICLFLTMTAADTLAVESKYWKEFKHAKEKGLELPLPDFSYAGYNYSNTPTPDTSGWPKFKVKDFGGLPDDDKYDDVAIQAAIDAAAKNGRGVVVFQAGRYMVSPTEETDPSLQMRIHSSNIVLKGKGSGTKGTNIFVDKMKLDGYGVPQFLVSPPVVQAIEADMQTAKTDVTTLVGEIKRETSVLKVKDASKLNEGDTIMIWTRSTELRDDELGGLPVGDMWTQIKNTGIDVRELHTISKIKGNTITLGEPVHVTLKESYGVRVRTLNVIDHVGIEDLRFTGNWPSYGEDFIHHKKGDKVHDYGWTALQFLNVRNGWIDNVEFKDFNQSLNIRTSIAVTANQLKFTGKKGHASVIITQSYGVLVKDSQSLAGHHHGAGVAQRSSGGVYLRYKMAEGQQIDSHAGFPLASLYDNVSNGTLYGSGGAARAFPHHLNYFVGWNFKIKGDYDNFDFWDIKKRSPHVFLKPYFMGLHGKKVTFKAGTYAANESPGKRVSPYSLFEAQLGLRLLPGFELCCGEGSTRKFAEPTDIAFGTQGKYKIKYGVVGEVTLNRETFGDPVPGQRKSVYVRKTLKSESK